jgi:hypothetical protein
MKTNKFLMLIALISITFFTEVKADWQNSLSILNSYIENPFHYNGSVPISNHSMILSFTNLPSISNFSYNYTGNFSLIPQLSNSSLTDNLLQLNYKKYLDDSNRTDLNLSGAYSMGMNSGELNVYNNFSFLFSGNINYSFTESAIARAGYKSNYKNFFNNTSLSYFDQIAYIGFKKYFETNTSINSEINYGNKYYSGNLFSFSKMMSENNISKSTGQLIANLKIAQSLAEKTGLSILYSQSWNLNSSQTLNVVFDPNLIFDKEIYDDPYSYESRELTATLTHYFTNNYKLQLYAFYFDKSYNYNSDIINFANNDNRADATKGIGFMVEKNFDANFLIFQNIKLNLNYLYLNNSSNSEIFNFNSNEFGLNFKTNF